LLVDGTPDQRRRGVKMCNEPNRRARSARRLLTLALLSAAAIVPASAGAHAAAPAPSATPTLVFSGDAYDNEMGVHSRGRNVAFMDYIDDVP
jgi:hypothetical protein